MCHQIVCQVTNSNSSVTSTCSRVCSSTEKTAVWSRGSSMPKEQPCLNSPCTSPNKNGKENSDGATLQVTCDSKVAEMSSRKGSCYSSEKDSAFSDGSDWQHTDCDDQRSNKDQSRAAKLAETSQSDKNGEFGLPKKPDNLASLSVDAPVYIAKDVVLKKPSLTSTLQLYQPFSQRFSVTGRKVTSTYLHALNYPRIVPHLSRKPNDEASSSHKVQNVRKRVCSEQKSDDTSVTRGLPEEHIHKQPKLEDPAAGPLRSTLSGDRLSSSSPTTGFTSQTSSSVSTYSLHTVGSLYKNSAISTRNCHFLNTVKVLRQSGLLDITLRTKELMRQTMATQREITELHQHADLFYQAVTNPNRYLKQLHQVMTESGSYPNLKDIETIQTRSQPLSANQQEIIGNSFKSHAAQKCHHLACATPEKSNLEQGRKVKTCDEPSDLASPDSSAG
ncbi:CLOCK-interacting pacemaker-like isoform 3-T3 [Pholidichthys leucotaenia]